jgi:hypothetical protein
MAKKKSIEERLELSTEDGVRLVSFVAGFSLYTTALFSKHRIAVLDTYGRCLGLCPEGVFTFYATETMRRHKPVSAAALGMLPAWLKAGAPARDFIRMQLKSGVRYQDAPQFKIDVFGVEPKSELYDPTNANVFSVSFAPDTEAAQPVNLRQLFLDICEVLPFQSGHAGFALECSTYEPETSESHAWAASMRHWGLDIPRPVDDSIAVGADGVKGVGWLTALDAETLKAVGGLAKVRKALPRQVEVIELTKGVVIQAGSEPAVGDVNAGERLPLYRAVFRCVEPLVRQSAKRSPSLNLASDYVERTEQWFLRLADD